MTHPKLALVRRGYIANRSKQGHRSYKPLKGFFNYIAYGRHRDDMQQAAREPRGVWLDQHNAAHTHADVLQWAKQKVHRFGYDHAYQLLLSTRHGHLLPTDFTQTLTQGRSFSGVHEWRLMVHTDTAHQHAHAVLFRQKQFQQKEYKAWQQAMQQRLEQTQLARWQEIQLTQTQSQTQTWEQAL